MNAVPTLLKAREVAKRSAAVSRADRCPTCGCPVEHLRRRPLLKRGAVTLAYDPYEVRWRGRLVPLSPTEAHLVAMLLRRGRVTYDALDAALVEVGASPATRSLVLLHIRRKFERIGADSPFERIGTCALRFRVQGDEDSSTSTMIGLQEASDLQVLSAARGGVSRRR